MKREDILRELELLPVWQLRTALAFPTALQTSTKMAEPNIAEPSMTEASILEAEVKEIEKPDYAALLHIASEDGAWLFVTARPTLQADEALLLNNIFKAIRMTAQAPQLSMDTMAIIQTRPPKIIITMGEVAAQTLLKSTAPITALRGQLYQYQGITLIATLDPAHLLQNLPDKAKTWEDLRLAMRSLAELSL